MKGIWFFLLSILIAGLAVLVPYAALAGIGSFLASFLFWTLLTFIVIVAAGLYTRSWREQ